MGTSITQQKMNDALDWAYKKASEGMSGVESASELANSYRKKGGEPRDQINSLIRWQNTKAGTSGFITGLGGIMTLPIAIPANVFSVLFLQIRMVSAIAILAGKDLKDDKVKTMALLCLAGAGATDILKEAGIAAGKKLTEKALVNMSTKTLVMINKKVGITLVTKFGQKGAINLSKVVPILGGIIGATVDSVSTNLIGNLARNSFLDEDSKVAPKSVEADADTAQDNTAAALPINTNDAAADLPKQIKAPDASDSSNNPNEPHPA